MIGVRFSLYPMTDAFVPVILDAVQDLDRLGLEVEVDDVSTCLMGEEPQLFEALRVAFGRAARTGTHVVMVASFSAGCPGEPEGDVCAPRHVTLAELAQEQGTDNWVAEAYDLPERVACQFALYPLGIEHYMDVIYREIGGDKGSTGTLTRAALCHPPGRRWCRRVRCATDRLSQRPPRRCPRRDDGHDLRQQPQRADRLAVVTAKTESSRRRDHEEGSF